MFNTESIFNIVLWLELLLLIEVFSILEELLFIPNWHYSRSVDAAKDNICLQAVLGLDW